MEADLLGVSSFSIVPLLFGLFAVISDGVISVVLEGSPGTLCLRHCSHVSVWGFAEHLQFVVSNCCDCKSSGSDQPLWCLSSYRHQDFDFL